MNWLWLCGAARYRVCFDVPHSGRKCSPKLSLVARSWHQRTAPALRHFGFGDVKNEFVHFLGTIELRGRVLAFPRLLLSKSLKQSLKQSLSWIQAFVPQEDDRTGFEGGVMVGKIQHSITFPSKRQRCADSPFIKSVHAFQPSVSNHLNLYSPLFCSLNSGFEIV